MGRLILCRAQSNGGLRAHEHGSNHDHRPRGEAEPGTRGQRTTVLTVPILGSLNPGGGRRDGVPVMRPPAGTGAVAAMTGTDALATLASACRRS